MGYPYLEDPDSLGEGLEERCQWCDRLRERCGCSEPDPDSAYDRMMEDF